MWNIMRPKNSVGFLPDKLDCVRSMDAEEDVQDIGHSRPCLDALQAIVFLLRSERIFHPRCLTLARLLRMMSVSLYPCSTPYWRCRNSLHLHRLSSHSLRRASGASSGMGT